MSHLLRLSESYDRRVKKSIWPSPPSAKMNIDDQEAWDLFTFLKVKRIVLVFLKQDPGFPLSRE
jgi:hypothetical protein